MVHHRGMTAGLVPFLHSRGNLCERPEVHMTVKHALNPCPFCGVVADVPHKTQQGCIQALQTEIARMREILGQIRDPRLDLRGQDMS